MAKNDDNTAVGDEPPLAGGTAEPVKITRAQLREALFSADVQETKSIEISLSKQKLEWRTPTIQEVQELRDNQAERNFIISLLIGWTFVPGTDVKVFEDDDYADLMSRPYTGEWVNATQKIAATLELGVDDKVKN